MAEIYDDLDLGSGVNDGTTWPNAYQTLPGAATAANTAPGDRLWIKGTQSSSGSDLVLDFDGVASDQLIVQGVATATTNEPPVASDLIAGWRTGETRTIANRAYKDADVPSLTTTGSGDDIRIEGYAYIYGVNISAGRSIEIPGATGDVGLTFEECQLSVKNLIEMSEPSGGIHNNLLKLINCAVSVDSAFFLLGRYGNFHTEGLEYIEVAAPNGALFDGTICGCMTHRNGDFSALTKPYFDLTALEGGIFTFSNCRMASQALTTGTNIARYRIEAFLSDNTTGKSSGSITNYEMTSDAGDIVEELTAVRTGGANDGTSDWAMAITPNVDTTQDNYYGVVTPWMAIDVEGDGTSKTLTVYIANSGGADYNNDDVYLEATYPSEGGTAQHDNQTTQMTLLGTPVAVTDDTDSTWGTGGNNPQKLQATIAPDYEGTVQCRVVFAKNFGSSPETLYVDPLPEIA